jgi:hypothetical protein
VGNDASIPTDQVPEEIDGSCRAFRLIKPDWMKTDLTPVRPSSVAFQDHPEDHAMSVYLEDEILLSGLSVEELQKNWDGYWVFSVTVGELRETFGQVVTRDPQPGFPGHGAVRDSSGKRSAGKRSRMAAACVLVLEPSSADADVEE